MGRWIIAVCVLALAFAGQVFLGIESKSSTVIFSPASPAQFPYGSARFAKFVSDSYGAKGAGDPRAFFQWFDREFQKVEGKTVDSYLAARKKQIEAAKDRAGAEKALGGDLHRIVKKTIPKFSLDRGFEFVNTTNLGERQCFLQSVLVASLLQEAGVDSGVAMVYKNIAGQPTNNGHAVALVRLGNGTDVIVDCSDPEPFVEQKGLFLRSGERKYRYVEPVYENAIIKAYRPDGQSQEIQPRSVAMLDVPFLDSQFDYYRGERSIGGVLASKPTKVGLGESVRYLSKSVMECPENPLAVYMLGRAYRKQGRTDLAMKQFRAAKALYEKDGWVPQGVVDAMKS